MALSHRGRAPALGGPSGDWLNLQALALELGEDQETRGTSSLGSGGRGCLQHSRNRKVQVIYNSQDAHTIHTYL